MSGFSDKIVELKPEILAVPGSTNVGLVLDRHEDMTDVFLIDSGGTELDGEFLADGLDGYFSDRGENYRISAVINTHSHADHCGADAFLRSHRGCRILVPAGERGSLENPLLQPSLIWGGIPPHELRTVYYKMDPVMDAECYSERDRIELSGGKTISFVSLPGHYFQTMGILCRAADGRNVLFAGDSIFSRNEIGKYWIPFMIQPELFMESLDRICGIESLDVCVPGHGDFIFGNVAETAELDKIAILSTEKCILEIISGRKLTTEDVLKEVAERNGIKMGFGQYVLIGSTVRSYLSSLHDRGKIRIAIENNRLYWTD